MFRCTDTNEGFEILKQIHHHWGLTAQHCVHSAVRDQLNHNNTVLCSILQKSVSVNLYFFAVALMKSKSFLLIVHPYPAPSHLFCAPPFILTAANGAPILNLSQTLTECLTLNVRRGGLGRGNGASTSAGAARITSTMITG